VIWPKEFQRTLVIADGEIIEEYLARTFPGWLQTIGLDYLKAETQALRPGNIIVRKGEPIDTLHIVTRGAVEIVIEPPNGREFVVARFEKGQYFWRDRDVAGWQ